MPCRPASNQTYIGDEHRIIIGDARTMTEVPDRSVHLVVTSPPYWQLKDYGGDGEIVFVLVLVLRRSRCSCSCSILRKSQSTNHPGQHRNDSFDELLGRQGLTLSTTLEQIYNINDRPTLSR